MVQLLIANIKIGDTLHGGHRVNGVVEISSENVNLVGQYFVGDKCFTCGPNVTIHGHSLGIVHTSDLQYEPVTTPKLFSLITDTHLIPVEGYVCSDYDSRLDEVLHVDKMEVVGFSKKYID